MGNWEPTIGKWYDEENYDIKEPTWEMMLKAIPDREDARHVKEVLGWLARKNLYGDTARYYIIGYVLNQSNVDLKKYLWDAIISKIMDFSQKSNDLRTYTVLVMKEFHMSEEIIAEFETRD